MKLSEQKRIVVEVVRRVLQKSSQDPRGVEPLIFDTLYEEKKRLETEHHSKQARQESSFYKKMQSRTLHGGPKEQAWVLEKMIRHFAEEIAGHFNESIYRVATRIVPVGLNLLLNTWSPLRLLRDFPRGFGKLGDHILIQGETEMLQALARKGTVILVPTHCSNVDSPLIGYVLYRLGLPPFLYGAGLNLFHNRWLGFFMDHLGAYKVDRRKKAKLYKDVLKAFAGYSLELGCDNLFFSGGTRSRSGAVESRLKLGLLGMGLDAYIHNLQQGRSSPDIYIFPCTLNYQLVLEAETLIEDYLQASGRGRYIIQDDEFSRLRRIWEFLSGIFSLDSRIHVIVSRPLDVFGNAVDSEGNSLDPRGRSIDRRKYVAGKAAYSFEKQRDHEYTEELARNIVAAFRRDTVISSVQLVSRTLMSWLREQNPGMDFYRLLRTGGAQPSLPLTEAYRRLRRQHAALLALAKSGKIRVDAKLRAQDPVALLSDALAHFKSYYRHPVLERRGDRLFHEDWKLLFYYQNRLPTEGLP